MSKRMELAYKALHVEDAANAAMRRFRIAITCVGIAGIVMAAIGLYEVALIAFCGFLIIAAFGMLSVVAKFVATRVREATGFSEVELERLALL